MATITRTARHPIVRLMTRDAFEAWCARRAVHLAVRAPWTILACRCGDINCHGWRFVEHRGC